MGFLSSSIGSLVKTIVPKILPLVANAIGGPLLGMATDLFTKVAGSLLNQSGSGGLFSSTVPLSIPNPLSSLNGLASSVGTRFSNTGDFLSNIGDLLNGSRNVGGQQIYVPTFADRAGATQSVSQALESRATYAAEGYGGGSVLASSGGSGTLDAVANMPLFTADEQKDLSKLKPEDQAMMRLQRKMQRYNQMVQLMTNLMQMDHEAKMGVIRNVRA